MEFLKLLTLLSLLFYYSCSKSQDSKDASEGDDIEMVDGEESFEGEEDVEVVDSEEGFEDEEFADEEIAEEGEESWGDEEYADEGGEESWEDEGFEDEEELAESSEEGLEELGAVEEEVVADSEPAIEALDGAAYADTASEMPVVQEAPIPSPAPAVNIADAGPTSSYSVQPNETLMLISFKLYGDYTRWKEIQRLNSDKLGGSTVISPGMQLSYNTQGSGFVWNPQGRPYLIQRGDTLGIISDKVYNTMSKWRKIWDNNKPLIKDPNKIYAGFTLYYIPEDGRDLASEQMKETAAAPVAPAPEMNKAEMPQDDESFEEEDFPEEI